MLQELTTVAATVAPAEPASLNYIQLVLHASLPVQVVMLFARRNVGA